MASPLHIRRRMSRPLNSVIEGSKHAYVPGIREFSLFEITGAFKRQLGRTSLPERAAAISFNVFMAIPPTMLFLFTLVPLLPISKQFTRELFGIIRDIVPGEKNNSVIIGFLRDFLQRPRNGLLSFGLLLAMFFSSNAMMGILRSFDKNYEGFGKPTGLQKRKTAMRLTMIFFFTIFTCILLLVAQGAVLKWIGIRNGHVRGIIANTRWIIIVLLAFWSVSFIYRHGPAVTKKWPLITPGSVFATSLMILATTLVTFWVNNFSNYNKLYGSISAVFILMSLIFVNSLVLLIGFELNVTLVNLKRARAEAEDALKAPHEDLLS
ncbi:YihY/virulence factor BrkB family protein [Flaviaesturariibacter aridisoli]|uniref:YihY/virulence factor BrkB family protein n=1 Tax=Flaviaesturariibacter aridisoli TaxID=2545761 RepID=A0A4R4E7Y3_9BACT|nr:YihY/virulence factor BrkB family protein [Flaviaesturariibacter aridisoli]TCZ73835.1 YihY/virulence factor BrkB family protein [Flaviaesturariibacter aridisoli]